MKEPSTMTSSKYLQATLSKALKADTTVRMSGKVLRDFETYALERGYKVSHEGGSISPKGWYSVAVYL